MATIKSTLVLDDKMSKAFNNIDTSALQSIQTFNNMSSTVENLKKSLEDAEKANPKIVETEMYAKAAEELEEMEGKLYDVAEGEEKLNQKNKMLNVSMTELNQTLELLNKGMSAIKQLVGEAEKWVDADKIQQQAEVQLETVMRKRMGANNDMIQSVKDLTAEQQKLGVIGDEVQLNGAKQVATFLKSEKALKTLIPAMNNLAANQSGLNVTSSEMQNIGNMFGKVMQGQTSALTRVGITFTEAEEKALKFGTEEERAATLAQIITNNVGDMNSELAKTAQGGIKQAENNLGDLSEVLGNSVAPYFAEFKTMLVDILTPAVQWFADNMSWLAPILISVGAALAIMIGIITIYTVVTAIANVVTNMLSTAFRNTDVKNNASYNYNSSNNRSVIIFLEHQ